MVLIRNSILVKDVKRLFMHLLALYVFSLLCPFFNQVVWFFCLFFAFIFWLHNTWNLCSPTRDQTVTWLSTESLSLDLQGRKPLSLLLSSNTGRQTGLREELCLLSEQPVSSAGGTLGGGWGAIRQAEVRAECCRQPQAGVN